MNKADTIQELQEKIMYIDNKLEVVKMLIRKRDGNSILKESEQYFNFLKNIRDEIVHNYNQLTATGNKKRNRNTSELKNKIYANFEAFHSAFTKAGSMFRTYKDVNY